MRKLFAAILAVVLLSLTACSSKPAEPVVFNLPEQWQEFHRESLKTGKEALDLFQKEHAKKISWRDGAVAEYTDGKVKLRVWTAAGTSDGHASQMFLDMAARIGTNHKVFSAPQPVDLGGAKAYKTQGQDNANYFWFKGKKVFWVAVGGAADPEALVKRVMADFQ